MTYWISFCSINCEEYYGSEEVGLDLTRLKCKRDQKYGLNTPLLLLVNLVPLLDFLGNMKTVGIKMVYGTIYTRFPVHFQPPRCNAAGGCQARLGSALSRKPSSPTVNSLIDDFERMDISYCYAGVTEVEAQLILSSFILERVREEQHED